MSRSVPAKPKAGCLKRFVFLLCLAAAVLLGGCLVLIAVPQDLSDIGGYGKDPAAAEVRDLRGVLEQSVARGHAVTLSEEDINLWLGRHVVMSQQGLLAGHVGVKRVWVRLRQDEAEVVIERALFGWPMTLSMFVRVKQGEAEGTVGKLVELHGGPYSSAIPRVLRGGRFGRLVVPQGYLHLIKSAHAALGKACSEEVHLAFDEMVGIQIEDGKLLLDPRKVLDNPQSLR